MALDSSTPIQQKKVPAGTVLFEADRPAGLLCLLHDGQVGAFNKVALNGKRRRLFTLGKNSTPGFGALLLGQSYDAQYVTTADTVISAFPANGPFPKLILGKLNVGVMAVRSLAQEVLQSQQTLNKYSGFLARVLAMTDNLAIAYHKCNPQQFETKGEAAGDLIDPVISAARVAVSEFQQSGGHPPDPITEVWLQTDHSGLLKKNYEFESQFDLSEFNFLRRILALPANIQGAMFKADLAILEGLGRRLAHIQENNVQELYQLQDSLDAALENLYHGDYCYAEKFFLLSDLLDSGFTSVPIAEFSAILKFLRDSSQSVLGTYRQLQGVDYPDVSPALKKIETFLKTNSEVKQVEKQKETVSVVGADASKIRDELSGAPGKIMGFLQMPADETKKLLENLKKLRAEKNPLDSGGDPRKLRRAIATTYWKAYEAAYYRYTESKGNVPQMIKLMLRYGFFDDEMLDDEHLAYLYTNEDNTRASYPIIRATEWIDMVRAKEVPPSVDEMGQTYFEKMKMDHKDLGWKRESDMPDDINTPERRVHYEILNFLEVNTRLTSGSPTTAFPILTRYAITTPLDKAFVSFESLSSAIDEVLKVDFSAFHREVILNDEEKGILKEFVQKQVIPHFILVPSIGTKVMMWQDVSGRSKSSPGRISVPTFATADLYTLLLEAVAAFRWELTKTIMGADWNNVANSSITSDYTDYVQFFKKNRELSPELKEKLAAEFKRFRNDRDRFTNDYINWIKYESQGVLKLNKVVRNILYKHVPFAKDLRDNLSAQPAYADIHNRFKNIRNRKLKELEVKYRKYGDDIPSDLKDNLDFYGV